LFEVGICRSIRAGVAGDPTIERAPPPGNHPRGEWIAKSRSAALQNGDRKEAMTMTGAKVFTATKAKDREELGEVLTKWLRDNPRARILDKIVTQSSDNEFHCLTITIFYEMPTS
jgi:hypothetical protein